MYVSLLCYEMYCQPFVLTGGKHVYLGSVCFLCSQRSCLDTSCSALYCGLQVLESLYNINIKRYDANLCGRMTYCHQLCVVQVK